MNKAAFYILIMVLIAGAASVQGADPEGIRIYLPNEKIISGDVIELGEIAIVLGDDAIAEKINDLALGQFVMAGQEIKIDRQTILSRLASAGIKSKNVSFNGSEIIGVRRDEHSIASTRFLEVAREYLNAQLQGKKIDSIKLVRSASPYVMTEGIEDVELVAHMSAGQSDGMMRVTVSVIHHGVELNRQELIFGVQYQVHQVVATQDLPAGTMITPDNVKVETVVANSPETGAMIAPYGMITRQRVPRDRVIRDSMVEPKEAPVLVKRRQKVLLKLETGGFSVSTQGEALEDGKAGEMIRVKSGVNREQRIVIGTVMRDGTIRPVF